MKNKGGDEGWRPRDQRVTGEPEEEWRRRRRKLIGCALAQFPPPEPQPGQEEVESVSGERHRAIKKGGVG